VCAIVTLVVSYLTPAPERIVVDAFWGDTPKQALVEYNSQH